MNWPSHNIVPRPARQRRQLAEWLAERAIDQKLRDLDEVPADQACGPPVRYIQASEIRSGDIHILKPVPSAKSFGPVYVLLLLLEENSRMLAVPFSRYASPAVPGECLTGLRAVPLRTLCCWNARPVREAQLLPGYVKRLAGGKLEELRRKCGHVLYNQPVDVRLTRGFGPPVAHPADPRYAYLDEERLRLDLHLNINESDERRIIEYREQNAGQKTWLMAAEGRARYGEKPRDEI
ncbi:MAG TPA: hypothetical protein PKM67_03190 [Kiritimatiellia bacterium]|nr:hypothetical protein [Kiritimatiellia bacterium]HPA77335.1 hypothetical protein [Kiritimatiellia bacterium]HQQ04370.1 hypothetical protein [Kiritimatiellia bacterium]